MLTLITLGSTLHAEDGSDTPLYNPDDVTPGVIGFAFTVVFAVAVILIGLDLYRRVRRMRYREEIREEIAAELAENGLENDGQAAPLDRTSEPNLEPKNPHENNIDDQRSE